MSHDAPNAPTAPAADPQADTSRERRQPRPYPRKALLVVLRQCVLVAALLTTLSSLAGNVRDLLIVGDTCYAAGDGGLVLRSDDAGKTWRRLETKTTASFHAIVADGATLYFVGGQGVAGLPSRGGQGVILKTADGGKSFEPLAAGSLPCLYGGFAKGKVGAFFGEGGGRSPSGLWRTADGGQTWAPDALATTGYLLAGQWKASNSACLVGSSATLVEIRDVGGPILRNPALPQPRALRAVGILEDGTILAAGSAGIAFRSKLGQKEALPLSLDLPAGATLMADFRDLAIRNKDAYLAGGLWGGLLHSSDGGTKWKVLGGPRGGEAHTIALGNGYLLAGGSGGRIWRSTDNAAGWTLVAGKEKTDLMFIASGQDTSILPMVIAHVLAGDEVAVVLATTPEDPLVPVGQSLELALTQAGVASVTVLDDFPSQCAPTDETTPTADVLQAWSDLLDVPAEAALRRQLAAAIRLYKPSVLCVGPSESEPAGFRGENRLVARVALEAAKVAADAAGDPNLDKMGLPPWSCQRTWRGAESNEKPTLPGDGQRAPDRKGYEIVLDSSIFWQGQSQNIELQANRCAWTMCPRFVPRVPRYTAYSSSERKPRSMLTSGISQAAYQPRDASALERDLGGGVGVAFAMTTRGPATAVGLLARNAKEAGDNKELVALAADRMLLVWRSLLEQGRLAEAEEARREFLRIGTAHPLYERVLMTDLVFMFSREWRAQLELRGASPHAPAQDAATCIRTAQSLAVWADDPAFRLAIARAQFRSGKKAESQDTLKALAAGPFDQVWKDLALLDLAATAADTTRTSRRRIDVQPMTGKGEIDGRLNEAFWKKAAHLPLVTPQDKKPEGEHAGAEVKAVRTAGNFLVLGIELPQKTDRQWTLQLAIDADRETHMLAVLDLDMEGSKSFRLVSRLAPEATLESKSIQVDCRHDETYCSFELALPLELIGVAPDAPALTGVQLRAVGKGEKDTTVLLFQAQPDDQLAAERFGLMSLVPLEKKKAGNR